MNEELIKKNPTSAFTLVELMVATAIMGAISLAAITLNTAEKQSMITNDRLNNATVQTREFLDQRGKVLLSAWDEDEPAHRLDIFDFTDPETTELISDDVYSTDQIKPPTPTQSIPGFDGTAATAIKTFRSIRIPSEGCFGSFKETLTTECIIPPVALAPVDWSALSQSEILELRACAPQPDPESESEAPPCPFGTVPRIKIVRSGVLKTGNTPFRTTRYFPSGEMTGIDSNPVGAALCISINGARRAEPLFPYRDINLKVLTLVRTGANKIKLVRLEGNYARPKKIVIGKSILPSPVGCDRCASGRAKCP